MAHHKRSVTVEMTNIHRVPEEKVLDDDRTNNKQQKSDGCHEYYLTAGFSTSFRKPVLRTVASSMNVVL